MIKLLYVPCMDEMDEYYGDPNDANFKDENLGFFASPFPMRISWNKDQIARNLYLHKKIGLVVVDALEEIMNYEGYDYLRAHDYDIFGGGYNHRIMKGSDRLSTHSYGISLDMNPKLGPYEPNLYRIGKYKNKQPDFIIDAFEKRGFVNLPWDRMHFQAVKHPSVK
jgi:hypothetical protein